jgi:hypothetical protein
MTYKLKTWRTAAAPMAAILAALLATGAGKPPSAAARAAEIDAAVARLFPTPHLYSIVVSGTLGQQADGSQMCLSAEMIRKLISSVSQRPAPKGLPTKGCSERHAQKPDGSFRFELSCDRSAGAASTVHIVMEGAAKDMRHHLEMVVDDPASDAPRIISVDSHLTDAGPCPANMRPGQFRTAAGEIVDAPGPLVPPGR